MNTDTTDKMDRLITAIMQIKNAELDARVQTLYGAAGEPSIVIVVPGVRIVDGRLEAA